MRYCRRKDAAHNKVVYSNGWKCSICRSTGNTRYEFKKHIYYHHTNEEVDKYYQRSWRDELQESWLCRIRLQDLNNIKIGRYDSRWRFFAQAKYICNF